MNHYELYNKLLDKFTSIIMNDSCISTSCIATLMRIWSKYFFCSYTTLHFRFTRRVASGITAGNTSVGRNQRPQSIPKARKNLGADSMKKIMGKGSIKKIPKIVCIMTSWCRKMGRIMTAPITYYLQWSIWLMISFGLVFLARETRHATSSCCSKIHHTCLFDAGNIFPRNPWNSPSSWPDPWWRVGEFWPHLCETSNKIERHTLCQEFLWESRWVLPKGAGLWMGSQEEHLGRIVPVLRDFTMPQEGKSTLTFVGGSTGTFFGRWLSTLQKRCLCFSYPVLFGFCWILHPSKQTWNLNMNPGKEISIGNYGIYPFQVLC